MIFTPLEQFSINNLLLIRIGNVYLSFTNSSLYLLIATGLILLLLYLITLNGGYLLPPRWQSVVEMIYQFVASLVEQHIRMVGRLCIPLMLSNFFFHFSVKLMGWLPWNHHCMGIIAFCMRFSLYLGVLFYYLWIFLSIFFEAGVNCFPLYNLETFLAPLGESQESGSLINLYGDPDQDSSEIMEQGGNQIAPQNNGHAAHENSGHGVDNPVGQINDDDGKYFGENPFLKGLEEFNAADGGHVSPEIQKMMKNHEEYQGEQRAAKEAAHLLTLKNKK